MQVIFTSWMFWIRRWGQMKQISFKSISKEKTFFWENNNNNNSSNTIFCGKSLKLDHEYELCNIQAID